MNADIRLSVEFLDHPKTVKLQRRLGLEAVLCLLRLWTWAAQNRSDGVLQNMDVESIEIAARWNGEENALLGALITLNFVDEVDGKYCLHNWSVHQEYAANEQARVEKAKKAAAARWGNKQALPESETGIAQNDSELCSDNATSNAPSMLQASSSNAPNQTKPREEKEEEKNPPYPPLGGNGCETEKPSQVERQSRRKKGESLDDVQSAIAECSAGNIELASAFEDFRVMRERMRKPLTVAAVRLTGGELANLAGNDVGQKIAILNQSVQRCWQGVFALKQDSRASPQSHRPQTAAQEKRALMAQNSQDVLKSREALRNDPQSPYSHGIGGNVRALPPAEAG